MDIILRTGLLVFISCFFCIISGYAADILYVRKGDTVHLLCPINAIDSWQEMDSKTFVADCSWTGDMTNLINPNVKNKMFVTSNCQLGIYNFTEEDPQEFQCIAPNVTHKIFIRLSEPPTNIRIEEENEMKEIYGVVDKSTTITCLVNSGIPEEIMTLKKNNELVSLGGPSLLKYTFVAKQSDDMSIMVCSAETEYYATLTKQVIFKIIDIPRITIPERLYLHEKDDLRLACTFNSTDPMATAKWLNGKSTHQTLYIDNINRTHSGNYTCQASSRAGHSRQTVEVIVQSILIKQIEAIPKSVVGEGDDLTLICHFDNIPEQTKVKWKYNNSVLLGSGQLYEYNSIHFHSLNRRQTGNYSCEVDTELGFDRKTIFVKINEKQLKMTSNTIVSFSLIMFGIFVSFLACWYIMKALKKKIMTHLKRNQSSMERSTRQESSEDYDESHYDEIDSVYYGPVEMHRSVDTVAQITASQVHIPIVENNDSYLVRSKQNYPVGKSAIETFKFTRMLQNSETVSNKTQSQTSDDSYLVPCISYTYRMTNENDMHQQINTCTDQVEISSISSNGSETCLKSDNQYEPLTSVNINEHPYLNCNSLGPN